MLRQILAVLLLTSLTSAQIVGPQPVSFTGVIEESPFTATGIICAPGGFQIECNGSSVLLQSSTIDLGLFLGVNVNATAYRVGDCPLYEVTAIALPPTTTLEFCGTPGLGCPIRLLSGPGALSQHWLFASASPGFLPISLTKGTLMLGEPFLLLGSQFIGGVEGAAFDFTVPSDAALTGVEVFFQSVRRDVGPVGPFRFGNPVCFTIPGFVFVCHPHECTLG